MSRLFLLGTLSLILTVSNNSSSYASNPSQYSLKHRLTPRDLSPRELSPRELSNNDYFSIRNARVEEVHEQHFLESTSDGALSDILKDVSSSTGTANIILDNIINLGKKIWALVDANKAVVNISSDRGNALPQGINSWEQMQEWKTPESRLFRVTYTNFLGMNVVDFTFRLIYTYGGTVHNKGLYLSQIGVIPAELVVRSGYTFNAHVSVPGVTNAGTIESPMAAAEILVSWSVDNVSKHIEGSQSYYVRGDGYFQNLSGILDEKPSPNSGSQEDSNESNSYDPFSSETSRYMP